MLYYIKMSSLLQRIKAKQEIIDEQTILNAYSLETTRDVNVGGKLNTGNLEAIRLLKANRMQNSGGFTGTDITLSGDLNALSVSAPTITGTDLIYGDTISGLNNVGSKIGTIEGTLSNKQDKLTQGDNVTIIDKVISASAGTSPPVPGKIFYASTTSTVVINNNVTAYYGTYGTPKRTNTEVYTFNGSDQVTILKSGTYKVEFSSTIFNTSYADRAVLGSIVSMNGSLDRTLGGFSCDYIRFDQYGCHGTTRNAICLDLQMNDTIRIFNGLNKANNIGFTSNFDGFNWELGSNLMITYLD
jgi:hypothetical protein